MKKILILILTVLVSASLFASTTIKGDFSLDGSLILNEEWNYSLDSNASMNLYLLSKSNNIKYTVQNETTINSEIENDLKQAYLQFRIPSKENFLTFTVGKAPLAIGSSGLFNSGTPFNAAETIPWVGVMKTKLASFDNFQSLNLELIAKLPLQGEDAKAGSRITYDINNQNFGTLEVSFLSDFTSSTLSGGINGDLFFDYGVYGKVDLQNLNNFESSAYLLKIYPKFTFKIETQYLNNNKLLNLLPSVSYIIDNKSSLSISSITSISDNDWNANFNILYNFNIVQGLDLGINYSFNSEDKTNKVSATVTHKF